MTKPNDMPAFPAPNLKFDSKEEARDWNLKYSGMTIRDYFAGQALVGFLSASKISLSYYLRANMCYELADAMLAQREVPNDKK